LDHKLEKSENAKNTNFTNNKTSEKKDKMKYSTVNISFDCIPVHLQNPQKNSTMLNKSISNVSASNVTTRPSTGRPSSALIKSSHKTINQMMTPGELAAFKDKI